MYDFSSLYEEAFPKLEVKIKQKNSLVPGLLKITKSSKQKQKPYNKSLKPRRKENEVIYKAYKNLSEVIRKKSRRTYYSELFGKYKSDIKNTWKIIN